LKSFADNELPDVKLSLRDGTAIALHARTRELSTELRSHFMKRFIPAMPSLRSRMRVGALPVLAVVAALSAPVRTAHAQYGFGNVSDVCGGNSFTFCLAISAVQGTGVDANTLFLTVTNEGLHGSDEAPYGSLVFTSMGFNGYDDAPAFDSPAAGTSFKSSDAIKDLSNFKPGPWVGVEAKNPSPKNGLLFGQSITFAFTNTTVATFAETDFAIHAQAGPAGCSSKLVIDLSQGAKANGADFIGSDCGSPVTATPEPASLLLMATGFFGVGAVVRRRRART
jgi:hypothetical protein